MNRRTILGPEAQQRIRRLGSRLTPAAAMLLGSVIKMIAMVTAENTFIMNLLIPVLHSILSSRFISPTFLYNHIYFSIDNIWICALYSFLEYLELICKARLLQFAPVDAAPARHRRLRNTYLLTTYICLEKPIVITSCLAGLVGLALPKKSFLPVRASRNV